MDKCSWTLCQIIRNVIQFQPNAFSINVINTITNRHPHRQNNHEGIFNEIYPHHHKNIRISFNESKCQVSVAVSANYPEEERWGQHSLVIIKIRQPANYPGVQIIHSMSTTGFSHFANDLRDRLSSFTHVAVLATMRQQMICHNVLFILFVNTVYSINPCTP